MSPVIYPTGTCFDDALDLLVEFLKEQRVVVLVHAICRLPESGTPYAHAWVEEETPRGTVIWSGGIAEGARVAYAVERAEMLVHLNPIEMTVYTPDAAYEENQRSGHYGPWLPHYEALCKGQAGQRRDVV